jgi:hypothetical protein
MASTEQRGLAVNGKAAKLNQTGSQYDIARLMHDGRSSGLAAMD